MSGIIQSGTPGRDERNAERAERKAKEVYEWMGPLVAVFMTVRDNGDSDPIPMGKMRERARTSVEELGAQFRHLTEDLQLFFEVDGQLWRISTRLGEKGQVVTNLYMAERCPGQQHSSKKHIVWLEIEKAENPDTPEEGYTTTWHEKLAEFETDEDAMRFVKQVRSAADVIKRLENQGEQGG